MCISDRVLPVTSGMFLEKVKGLAAAGKIREESRVIDVYKRQGIKTFGMTGKTAGQQGKKRISPMILSLKLS